MSIHRVVELETTIRLADLNVNPTGADKPDRQCPVISWDDREGRSLLMLLDVDARAIIDGNSSVGRDPGNKKTMSPGCILALRRLAIVVTIRTSMGGVHRVIRAVQEHPRRGCIP